MRLTLRQWQVEAYALWRASWKGVVRVVTGGGKTVFALHCAESFLAENPSGRIAIVVPTTALLDQWVVSLSEDGGVPSGETASYSGDEHPREPGRYNVLVINSARTKAPLLMNSGDWMLIVDECHRAGSEKNALALGGHYKAALGLSATPEREYDNGFSERVAPVLGPVIYGYDYVAAAKDGVICRFSLHNVRVAMLEEERASYSLFTRRIARERRRTEKGAGSEERLMRLMQMRAAILAQVTMRIPVAVKLVERNPTLRTIVFHERVEAANRLHAVLVKRRLPATIYHAGISGPVRRDSLRLYRKGVYGVLVCCRALDEGINVPETAVAVIASATASLRQRIQRLGRVLRPAPGKDSAEIYTIYASDLEEQRLIAEARSLESVAAVDWSRVR